MLNTKATLKNNIRYNRRQTEYVQCITAIKQAHFMANENSLNEDLVNMLDDILADANTFMKSELDDIENGF